MNPCKSVCRQGEKYKDRQPACRYKGKYEGSEGKSLDVKAHGGVAAITSLN